MNEALQLEVGHKVLEVGAGSGWRAATVAELVAPKNVPRSELGHVYSIEIVQALAKIARKNIRNASFGDCDTVINADGSKGYLRRHRMIVLLLRRQLRIFPNHCLTS
jgi:protein-L-isoaspartate(D-aspartate) O-methyltransferase